MNCSIRRFINPAIFDYSQYEQNEQKGGNTITTEYLPQEKEEILPLLAHSSNPLTTLTNPITTANKLTQFFRVTVYSDIALPYSSAFSYSISVKDSNITYRKLGKVGKSGGIGLPDLTDRRRNEAMRNLRIVLLYCHRISGKTGTDKDKTPVTCIEYGPLGFLDC